MTLTTHAPSFFARPAAEVAIDLLGDTLIVGECHGTIVEVESYDQDDPASHSHRGPTPRAAVMFGPPGVLYVYRSYGLHWCANVVCGPVGTGAAVLIRAIAPHDGLGLMRRRRGEVPDRLLCSGPGRLCQAFGIDGSFNTTSLKDGPAELAAGPTPRRILVGPRIGISVSTEALLRFGIDSPHLSRPFPRTAV